MDCDIHYDSKDLDATKVDADFYGKDFADELADIASLIDGILNIVVIKHCMPGDWEETSTTFKDVLISLMSNREGTDIESFAKIFGLNWLCYVIFIMMLTTRKQQKLRSSLTVATSEARLRKWQALSRR